MTADTEGLRRLLAALPAYLHGAWHLVPDPGGEPCELCDEPTPDLGKHMLARPGSDVGIAVVLSDDAQDAVAALLVGAVNSLGPLLDELAALRAKAAVSVCAWCGVETAKDPGSILDHVRACDQRPDRDLLVNNGKLIEMLTALLRRDEAMEMLLREGVRPLIEASPESDLRTSVLETVDLALGSVAESVPTESQPTGGGDHDEVCTSCGKAVVEPHPWRTCLASMSDHLSSVTDHAVDLQLRLDAALAEAREASAHADRMGAVDAVASRLGVLATEAGVSLDPALDVLTRERDAALALLREAGALVVHYGLERNEDVHAWALRVADACRSAPAPSTTVSARLEVAEARIGELEQLLRACRGDDDADQMGLYELGLNAALADSLSEKESAFIHAADAIGGRLDAALAGVKP